MIKGFTVLVEHALRRKDRKARTARTYLRARRVLRRWRTFINRNILRRYFESWRQSWLSGIMQRLITARRAHSLKARTFAYMRDRAVNGAYLEAGKQKDF